MAKAKTTTASKPAAPKKAAKPATPSADATTSASPNGDGFSDFATATRKTYKDWKKSREKEDKGFSNDLVSPGTYEAKCIGLGAGVNDNGPWTNLRYVILAGPAKGTALSNFYNHSLTNADGDYWQRDQFFQHLRVLNFGTEDLEPEDLSQVGGELAATNPEVKIQVKHRKGDDRVFQSIRPLKLT